jgi:hypothetical protein
MHQAKKLLDGRERGWPRPPARGPAREGGGGRDAALAAMAAVGMWLGSADEGSPPEGRGAGRLQSGRAVGREIGS